MRKSNTNKKERVEARKKAISEAQKGSGLFLYKNKSNEATLQLPKISCDGKRWIGPNETWEGDSFFLRMIPKEAILVKTLISPDQQKEKIMNEEKLILDQPDQITSNGKVEHIISSEENNLNENLNKNKRKNKKENNKNKLLTEDPIAGLTIIRD